MEKIVVVSFYKFVSLKDDRHLQKDLYQACQHIGIKGTILLAPEGINGNIAGPRQGIDAILGLLRQDPRFHDLEHKESFCKKMPFRRLKVRLKKEIITIGIPDVDPTQVVGTYVDPMDWNDLISNPEVLVIDTRNDYEVQIGTFVKAVDPQTKHFGGFPQFVQERLNPRKHKKIALCCTGGIRCEKASSYLKMQGFEEVYHLKGGILKYLEQVPPDKSLWQGECFLFDERVAVTHGLTVGTHELCYGCRRPIDQSDQSSPLYQEGVFCPQCYHETTAEQKSRFAERQRQNQLAKNRDYTLKGIPQHEDWA